MPIAASSFLTGYTLASLLLAHGTIDYFTVNHVKRKSPESGATTKIATFEHINSCGMAVDCETLVINNYIVV